MDNLNTLEKETRKLLKAIFSTANEVDEEQINRLINKVNNNMELNSEPSYFELHQEVSSLAMKKEIIEDAAINTLAYYIGMKERYKKEFDYEKNYSKTI